MTTHVRYSEEAQGLSEAVEQLLNINNSKARAKQLRSVLVRNITHEPQPRSDSDVVFLAAFPQAARQIRPLLRFHRAEDVPVLATSHVYEGLANPQADQDLDGVMFADMPWVLTPNEHSLPTQVRNLWPDASGALGRLYAFGADAYTLIARLRELRETVKSIRFNLDNLFEQNSALEAGRDVLTRLLNRKFLPVVLNRQVGHARSHASVFSVLALDIDHFKRINDGFGHEAGDRVLQQLATVLVNSSRAGDYLFRLGGEEFLMLLVDTDLSGARRAAEKLRRSVEREVFRLPQERRLNVTLSVGVACFNGHPDYQQLMRRADEALYEAKHSGRNRVVVVE